MPETIAPDVTLVLTSDGFDGSSDDEHPSLFPEHPAAHEVLVVTVTESPDRWADRWRRHASGKPAHLGFVTCDAETRTTMTKTGGKQDLGSGLSVRTVPDHADLTGLNVAVCAYLDEWRDTDTQPLVYFDSLTPLFQELKYQAVVQFTDILASRIRAAGGRAYFHLDPDAHGKETITALEMMVDSVVGV